jgi:hypothetical protein
MADQPSRIDDDNTSDDPQGPHISVLISACTGDNIRKDLNPLEAMPEQEREAMDIVLKNLPKILEVHMSKMHTAGTFQPGLDMDKNILEEIRRFADGHEILKASPSSGLLVRIEFLQDTKSMRVGWAIADDLSSEDMDLRPQGMSVEDMQVLLQDPENRFAFVVCRVPREDPDDEGAHWLARVVNFFDASSVLDLSLGSTPPILLLEDNDDDSGADDLAASIQRATIECGPAAADDEPITAVAADDESITGWPEK